MLATRKAKKLTVYLTESDTRHGRPVYEIVVELAHKLGLAGATVTRGVLGYGASGRVHVAHPDLISKLPVCIEIIDSPDPFCVIDTLIPVCFSNAAIAAVHHSTWTLHRTLSCACAAVEFDDGVDEGHCCVQ